MKYLHLTMVVLTLILFVCTTGQILYKKQPSKAFQMISHVVYTGLLLSGGYLLATLMRVASVQWWAVAKITLLVLSIAGFIVAKRKGASWLVVAWLCVVGIVVLAITKPF